MSREDDAFGWAIRRAFGGKDAEIARLTADLAEHRHCAATLAALRAELIAAKRDRDDWKRQAQALADRNAELREDVHRAQGPFGHLEGRPDGNVDARRGGPRP